MKDIVEDKNKTFEQHAAQGFLLIGQKVFF